MKELLSSGATIEVSIAPIQVGFKLFQAVVQEFKKSGINFDFSSDDEVKSLKDVFAKNPDKFISGLLDVVTSDKVLALVMECGKSAVYTKNGVAQKVSFDSFENEECREDFFEAAKVIVEKNIRPFFPKALMSSKPTTA